MWSAGLLAILSFAGAAFAQGVVSDWLPLKTGDKWVYQHDTRDQIARDEIETHSWETEEIIAGSWSMQGGTLIGRHVRVVEGSPRHDSQLTGDPAYFIRGMCVYGTGRSPMSDSRRFTSGTSRAIQARA